MRRFTRSRYLSGLAVWLAITLLAAAVARAASLDAGAFYAQLVRPEWAPPAWLFAPVWAMLYVLMAVAAWLAWAVAGFRGARGALSLFVIQLALNALWSWLFFGWHRGALAFTDIVILWVMIVATVIAFWRVRPAAGALLVPYLLWVSFAGVLSYTVWQLNPQSLGV